MAQLPSNHLPYILLTRGEQECVIAYVHGFNAISFQVQSQMPTAELLRDLYSRAAVLLSCYGNDTCGFQSSSRLENLFGIVAVRLPGDVKDIAAYFQKYSTESFTALLEEGIAKSKSLQLIRGSSDEQGIGRKNNTHNRLKGYLYEAFELRYNVIALEMEIRSKQEISQWQKINIASLCLELNKREMNTSCSKLKCFLQALSVPAYNPIQAYFLAFETKKADTDYIKELARYVILEDASDASFEYWYVHLKKWMIRAIRSVFEDAEINNYALILIAKDRHVTNNFFRALLSPSVLMRYYTDNLVIRDKKACQLSLASSFMINLQELYQFKSYLKALKLQSFIDQTSVRVCFPYQKNTLLRPRIASFVGTISALQFLRHAHLNTNHFIRFCITGIKNIDDKAGALLDLAWQQAYYLYKKNNRPVA
ncbi:VapE domain-containing protein [Cardinium endosymbiont of Tipula unca]|uniref:VapE domain-containing protein n=1 Tax=Cardinium endosymbiont of Tipula unca TaxID=3066216 RepID=UPI0030D19219